MKTSIFLIFPVLLLFACDSPDQIENSSAKRDSTIVERYPGHDDIDARDTISTKPASEFQQVFSRFQTAVFNEDAETLNQFIDPKRGLYIIENPGEMPQMTLVKDIRNFKREFQKKSFFTIKDRLQTCELTPGALPTFNCDDQAGSKSGYSKEGCFVADAEAFRQTEIHHFASLPEEVLKEIEKTLPLVQKTVLQTSSSYRFHFGKVNGYWKLLFIDLRIPCKA